MRVSALRSAPLNAFTVFVPDLVSLEVLFSRWVAGARDLRPSPQSDRIGTCRTAGIGFVSALAIDPQNSIPVYAGTGAGVFKSMDGEKAGVR